TGAIQEAQLRVRNRETWINLDRAFEQRDRCRRAYCAIRRAVRLQRVERGRAGLFERCRVLPHGRQRFADACPELRREPAEDVHHVFFPRCLELFLVEQIAGRAVLRAQAEDVLRAEARNRSPDDRGAPRAHADVARYVVGQRRRWRLAHQLQRSADAVVGDDAQKRRLPELYRESLSERLIEHRVTRPVDEVRQDDRVFVRQRWRTVKIQPPRDYRGDDDDGCRQANYRAAAGAEIRSRPSRWRRRQAPRLAIVLQTLEVRANLRRVLVAKAAILLQALADDLLEFRRHVGIQLRGGRGRAIQNAVEDQSRADTRKRHRTGRHFVQDDTEREQIRAGVEVLSADLFRRHVGDCSEWTSRTGQHRSRGHRRPGL